MVQGIWVGTISLFLYFCSFLFSVRRSSLMSASIAWDGVGCFSLCLDPIPFLRSSHLSLLLLSFLDVDARRHRGGGISVFV